MDMGCLIAKRQKLQIWSVTPLVLLLLLGALAGAFRNHKITVLDEQDRLYKIIPQMEEMIESSKDLLNEFSTSTSGGNIPEEKLITVFNKIAEEENFNLTSASVNLKRIKIGQPIMELEAVINGEGTLPSIIKFIDSAKSQQRLLNEKEFQIQQLPDQDIYSVKLVFSRMALQNGKTGNE
jgi:multidrug efflux pump subunit AcrB